MPHSQLVALMNRQCDEFNSYLQRLQPAIQRADAAGDQAAQADLTAKQARLGMKLDDELAAVHPSPEDRDAFTRFLAAVRHDDGIRARIATAYRSHDTAGANTLGQLLQEDVKQRVTAAIDLGLDKCGKP